MCWGADIHSGADGHRASVKCAAVRRQLSTHGYIRSQDECDFRPRTKLLPNLCCATGWSAFAAARKGPGQPPECAAAGIPARERPFPSRTSHLPLVRVFKKQYGLSSCHGSVIFKRTRMQSSWSRGRGETLRTYTGLCSEMQPDALRRSSHMLHVTLPFNSVSCWHDRSRSELSAAKGVANALKHPTRACSCRNRQSCVAGSTTCEGTNSYRGPPRIRAPLPWGSRSWTTSADAAGSTAGQKKCTSIAQREHNNKHSQRCLRADACCTRGSVMAWGHRTGKTKTLGRSAWGLGLGPT